MMKLVLAGRHVRLPGGGVGVGVGGCAGPDPPPVGARPAPALLRRRGAAPSMGRQAEPPGAARHAQGPVQVGAAAVKFFVCNELHHRHTQGFSSSLTTV